MSHKNKITVIGLGYIGLPTAAVSSKGYYVNGIDINDHIGNIVLKVRFTLLNLC